MTGQLSIERELDVMSNWKLDANSWYLIRLLFVAKYEGNNQLLIKYVNECSGKGVIKDTLNLLKERKILSSTYKVPEAGERFDIDKLEFNESFIKRYFKKSCEAGRELFEAYPRFLVMDDGLHLPARNITSKVVFKDLDAFFFFYGKSIKWDKELHEKVLKALEFAKEKKLIRSAIVEFVISEKYMDFIEIMESDQIGKFSTRFDTIKF